MSLGRSFVGSVLAWFSSGISKIFGEFGGKKFDKRKSGLAGHSPLGFTPKDKGGKCHKAHAKNRACFRKRNKIEHRARRKMARMNRRKS